MVVRGPSGVASALRARSAADLSWARKAAESGPLVMPAVHVCWADSASMPPLVLLPTNSSEYVKTLFSSDADQV